MNVARCTWDDNVDPGAAALRPDRQREPWREARGVRREATGGKIVER